MSAALEFGDEPLSRPELLGYHVAFEKGCRASAVPSTRNSQRKRCQDIPRHLHRLDPPFSAAPSGRGGTALLPRPVDGQVVWEGRSRPHDLAGGLSSAVHLGDD